MGAGVVSGTETTPVNNNNGHRWSLEIETTPVNNNNGRGGVGTETTHVNNNNGRGGVGTETTHVNNNKWAQVVSGLKRHM